ncbi:ABC transporter ATP-binding protein [Anaerolentibacter hominis]|uniref:ABC transporter ATP-binding protein n=1 Tax=Anaerolentibacter hominis TaxID=3079009 RepID=UPI0031B8237F
MAKLLHVNHVNYSYHELSGETIALEDVDFTVDEGEFVGIVGPSGCGKSTLLSLIAGLLQPESGSIEINQNSIGYMLQKDHLLEWRTTLKNITLGLEVQNKLTDDSYLMIDEKLQTYGLFGFRDTKPSGLSGGMRQRAALIRTLLLEPDILLLDEPFSALDYQTRLEVSDDIWQIIKKEQKTAILITHDIAEAISMSDRVIVMSARPGTVIREVPIHMTVEGERTPFHMRSAPEFSHYFNLIWEELNHGGSQKE